MNFNNLIMPNYQDDHSSFGGAGEKLENYKSFFQQHIINKEKKPLENPDWYLSPRKTKFFTKSHHASTFYYKDPAGYEHVKIKRKATKVLMEFWIMVMNTSSVQAFSAHLKVQLSAT